MAGIVVITNPNARRNKKDPALLERLTARLGAHGEIVATRSKEELVRAFTRLRGEGIDVLAINGGDGSNHFTLTTLFETWEGLPLPTVAMLCGGTMNTTARGFGITGSPEKLLGELIRCREEGGPLPTREVDILKAGDAYGFLFGTGMMYNFLARYYEGGDTGPLKAAEVLARTVGSAIVGGPWTQQLFERSRMSVEVDGKVWPLDTFDAVSVGMVPDIGLSFKPWYRAQERPGAFHIIGLACGALELSLRLPRVFAGRPLDHPQVIDQLAQRATLRADEIKYQFDGDLYITHRSLSLSTGPRLRLFVPGG